MGAKGEAGNTQPGAGVLVGSIKLIDSSSIANFDLSTGAGSNDWTGWAMCDGRNGTQDLRGRCVFQQSSNNDGTPNSSPLML